MDGVLLFIFVTYFLSAGFGLLVGGTPGLEKAHRFWLRTITGTVGWVLDQLGNGLKALGRFVRR